MTAFLPGGEPFYFPGGPTGCLLIHGFTSSPQEMRLLGEYLSKKGHTVAGIRLFGHAAQPQALNRARWEDWYASVEDGYHILSRSCKQIIPIGISLGGALALILAHLQPVQAVIAMATPYKLPFGGNSMFLQIALTAASKIFPSKRKGAGDWNAPDAAAARVQYDEYPLAGVGQLIPMLARMRQILPALVVPVFLLHSRSDGFVPPEHMPAIFKLISSEEKSMQWVDHSNHIVTCDIDREEVFEKVGAFIQRLNQGAE